MLSAIMLDLEDDDRRRRRRCLGTGWWGRYFKQACLSSPMMIVVYGGPGSRTAFTTMKGRGCAEPNDWQNAMEARGVS